MASCNNSYLKTGSEPSVLQLLKVASEEIVSSSLQVFLCDEQDLEFKRFEQKLAPNQSLLYHDEDEYFHGKKDYIDKEPVERIRSLETKIAAIQSVLAVLLEPQLEQEQQKEANIVE
jgi:hypothetical protein